MTSTSNPCLLKIPASLATQGGAIDPDREVKAMRILRSGSAAREGAAERKTRATRNTKSTRTFSITGPSRKTSRSEEHTSELQSRLHLVCRLLLEKKKQNHTI